jgi:hypothetical protein
MDVSTKFSQVETCRKIFSTKYGSNRISWCLRRTGWFVFPTAHEVGCTTVLRGQANVSDIMLQNDRTLTSLQHNTSCCDLGVYWPVLRGFLEPRLGTSLCASFSRHILVLLGRLSQQITVIVSISVSIAMYCLIQLYVSVSAHLQPQKPLLKLFAVKAVGEFCCHDCI